MKKQQQPWISKYLPRIFSVRSLKADAFWALSGIALALLSQLQSWQGPCGPGVPQISYASFDIVRQVLRGSGVTHRPKENEELGHVWWKCLSLGSHVHLESMPLV